MAQAAALFGGHEYIQRTTGLTYADYVHQGFGQLTAATVLTLATVALAVRKAPRSTARERLVLRVALGALCGLTLVVVASALHRMDLYQQAYGFTLLRVLVDAFELWLGLLVVLVLVAGVRLSGWSNPLLPGPAWTRCVLFPLETLRTRLGDREGARPFNEALVRPGLSLIAEFKRRSPSAGEVRPDAGVAETVRAYERGGAAALSILTEERQFGGSLHDLRAAREASELPILRKDFVVDPYQLYESAANGADAVLLIVGAVRDNELATLYQQARELDLDCLVEVHDEAELERALKIDADVLGINNRNLDDFTVDVETTVRLLTDVPAGKAVVSESGYEHREQLDELERIGVDAVLIGEALMRAEEPEIAVRELTRDEEATREHYLERASEE